jgi:hypothetical protein
VRQTLVSVIVTPGEGACQGFVNGSGPGRVGIRPTPNTRYLHQKETVWFKGGVVRVTVRADESETNPHIRMAQEWRKLAQDGPLLGGLWAISLGPGGDPVRGVFGAGRAEVARAQTTNMPSLVSVDSTCLQPTSGPGSRVSDRPTVRATDASNVRSPERGRLVQTWGQQAGHTGVDRALVFVAGATRIRS